MASGGYGGIGSSSGAAIKVKPARHVYKTGAAGCGGKAAPTSAKNSGAPLPCPFCDRIFKQDGRLKEHLKNKHGDENEDNLQNGDGDSAPLDTQVVEQAADLQPKQSSYPVKTPKTLLYEWCQKNKRPVPKFKHVEVPGGGYHCRIILPDGKKSEADVILWYRDAPTRSSQDAQHRAAVIGLHSILGNRRIDRILPEEYRQQWHDLDLAAEKHKAYLKANPPQSKPRPAPQPRELHSVFMSENNRRLVEDLLRVGENGSHTMSDGLLSQDEDVSHRESNLTVSEDSVEMNGKSRREEAVHPEESWEHIFQDLAVSGTKDLSRERSTANSTQTVRRKLLSLGFTTTHINLALAERHDLPSALDWLILNVPEQDLPIRFAPIASKASVQVLVRGKQPAYDVSASLKEDSIPYLQECGYEFADCVAALAEANGDQELALFFLFNYLFDGMLENFDGVDVSKDELTEIRAEETLALQAIYNENASISDSLSVFSIPMPEDIGASLRMEVKISPTSSYPFQIPQVGFRSKKLPAAFLLDITKQVVGKATELLGFPMIYELLHVATDLAQDLVFKHCGPTMGSDWGHESSLSNCESVIPPENISAEEILPLPVHIQTSLSSSAVHGEDISIAKAYVPPALRQVPTSTAPQPLNQKEVGSGSIQIQANNVKEMKRKVTTVDIYKESAKLKTHWESLQKVGRYGDMWAVRSKLPAFAQRSDLLSAINTHQVTIIAGQTGCGKSTQVPQYVLEDYIEKDQGALCNIICTQPRRLSAIGLADRVSKERGQSVGDTVGYTVRLESMRSHNTRLLFCTTGILLRRMLSDPDLKGVTHIVIDEVHERSMESDLLLLLVRELLKRVGSGPRLILMSATADTTLFLHYFRQVQLDPCVVSIPGFTFPVQELYLEDALDITGYKVGRNSRYAMKKKVTLPNFANSTESAISPNVDMDMDNWESLAEETSREDTIDLADYSETTRQSLSIVDQSLINYDLIELVIVAILEEGLPLKVTEMVSEGVEGQRVKQAGDRKESDAILVFLPGIAEIRKLQRLLQSSSQIGAIHSGSLWVLALHGSLSSEEQKRVFSRPPPGCRKIVLATNIAETSVTIDDVVYVIDTGRHKEMRYDHTRGISCLEETWVAKASAKQRRGRAGRVQSGYCIRLFSRQQFQSFDDQQLPEILRVSLDGLCLKVKSFLADKVEVSASKIITPPDMESVHTSLKNLQDLNALDAAERLTPLGHHLAKMPLDARVGKMLIFGCMLRCLDPVLTIAAALSGRSPFLSPLDKREEATAARQRFVGASKSDHLTIVSAYNGWLSAKQNGRSAESNFCTENFLSRETFVGIEASRQDFLKILVDIGFIPGTSKGADHSLPDSELHSNSNIVRVVKAVICAGFYPSIVRVHHPEKTYVQTEGGTVAKIAAARELRFFTKADGRVFLHPASVNFSVGKFESPWLVFSEKIKTSKVFLKDCTMVPAYGLLLFGGKVQVKHERQAITVDDWLEFEAPARIAVLIKELRSKVDALLFEKIGSPALEISSSPVVSALIRLLTTDGF